MNRKQFIESHGATCRNWQWSWSFVNDSEKFVIFGAWDDLTNGPMAVILSENWRVRRDSGRKNPGYDQSQEHIRLIEEEGYRLMTFAMRGHDDADGHVRIRGFTPELSEKKLTKIGECWYAVDLASETH